MFCRSQPTQSTIDTFLAAQQNQNFSYPEVGASRKEAPSAYTVDHNRIQLGQGLQIFERAKLAIRQWKMFDIPWIQLCWPNAAIEPGATVAVLVSHLGFWSLNAARIVYTMEEYGPIHKFGFAYGTLPNHAERGEERFSVEFNLEDQSVTYDLYAFSQPNTLARLAYPLTRSLQKRFAQDSRAAMENTVHKSCDLTTGRVS